MSHKNNFLCRSGNRSWHKNNSFCRSGNRSWHKNNSPSRSGNRSWHKNNSPSRSGNRSWHKNNSPSRSGNRSFMIFTTKSINPDRYKSIIETPQSKKKIAICCIHRPSPPFSIHTALRHHRMPRHHRCRQSKGGVARDARKHPNQ